MPEIPLGDITIPSYVLLLLLGAAAIIVYLRYWGIPASGLKEAQLKKLSRHFPALVLLSLILAIIGARLAFVIINWEMFAHRSGWIILEVWRGGLTFHGGVILVLIGFAVYCYRSGLPLGKMLDLLAPPLALGYAIGRIGCFLNGCCYGHPTELPWGVVFPAVDQVARHPTQLYAFLFSLLVFFILLYLRRYSFSPGFVFTWLLVLHSAYRFVVEIFRVSSPFIYHLSLAQVFTVILVVMGLLFFLWQRKRGTLRG